MDRRHQDRPGLLVNERRAGLVPIIGENIGGHATCAAVTAVNRVADRCEPECEERKSDRLSEVDPATRDERTHLRPVSALPEQEDVDHRVHREQMEALLDRQRCRGWEMPYDSDDAFWNHLELTLSVPR